RYRVERRFAEADESDVARLSPDVAAVVIHVRRDFSRRNCRMRREVLRAEEPLLFGTDEQQHDRSPRRFGQSRESRADLEHHTDAARIVARTVVDAVRGIARIRLTLAEVIVV